MAFRPDFITCTYGAGGSTRHKTLDIVEQVQRQFGCPVASHLTCVGSTVDELRAYLREAAQRGIDNIVALRGDPPKGETQFKPVAGGLTYANELVALIRGEFPQFGIAVAGYPETHREAPSPEADLENLRRKVDAGADVVITQLFYDNDDFFRFRDRCAAGRHPRADRAGHPAGDQPGADPADHVAVRGPLAARLSGSACSNRPTAPRTSSRSASSSPPGRCRHWSTRACRACTSTCSTSRRPRPACCEAVPRA